MRHGHCATRFPPLLPVWLGVKVFDGRCVREFTWRSALHGLLGSVGSCTENFCSHQPVRESSSHTSASGVSVPEKTKTNTWHLRRMEGFNRAASHLFCAPAGTPANKIRGFFSFTSAKCTASLWMFKKKNPQSFSVVTFSNLNQFFGRFLIFGEKKSTELLIKMKPEILRQCKTSFPISTTSDGNSCTLWTKSVLGLFRNYFNDSCFSLFASF